jgi:competence protein ComEA
MKKLLLTVVACLAVYGLAIAAVNINTATKEELLSLKGVGEKRAEEIINYRIKNGLFKGVDDLGKVPGIGPGLMKQIRSDITVSGKTVTDKPAAGSTRTAPKAGDSPKSEKATNAKPSTEKSKAEKK